MEYPLVRFGWRWRVCAVGDDDFVSHFAFTTPGT